MYGGDKGRLGELQTRLALEAVRYELSTAELRRQEAKLTEEVLEAYQARAAAIADQLGRPGFRLVELALGSRTSPPPRPVGRQMAMAADARAGGNPRLIVKLKVLISPFRRSSPAQNVFVVRVCPSPLGLRPTLQLTEDCVGQMMGERDISEEEELEGFNAAVRISFRIEKK